MTVTLSAKDLDPRLWEAAAKGRQFSTITITIGQATITLHGVVISGVNMGTDAASLTLNFSSMEFDARGHAASQRSPHRTTTWGVDLRRGLGFQGAPSICRCRSMSGCWLTWMNPSRGRSRSMASVSTAPRAMTRAMAVTGLRFFVSPAL